MALYRSQGRGSWIVQRRLLGIRVRRATGCYDRGQALEVEQTLLKLAEHGRKDVIVAFQRGEITGSELVASVVGYGVTFQLTVGSAIRLRRAMYEWLTNARLAPKTRRDYRWNIGALLGIKMPPLNEPLTPAQTQTLHQGPVLEDLPDLLVHYGRRAKPVMFVQVKAVCQAFVRDTVAKGAHSDLWRDVAAVQGPKRGRRDVQGGLTPGRARAVAEALATEYGATEGAMWWTLCCTGMGRREYWRMPREPGTGRWVVERDRILVHGTKRFARDRIVPRLTTPVRPAIGDKAFAKHLAKVGHDLGIRKLTPYVARRTFSHWLELAKIDGSRCDAYMGHSPKSDREKYREHDVVPYLAEDRKAFRAVVGDDPQFMRVVA